MESAGQLAPDGCVTRCKPMSLDASIKRRLMLGLIANWIGKMAGTVIQLVQIPFFLHSWPEAMYGEWLIINAIPRYLTLSNFGFGTVAANEMTMAAARGDHDLALRVFQSCWWLIVIVMAAVGIAITALLAVVPVSMLLNLHTISAQDANWIIGYLGIAVLVSQLETLLQASYRAIGRYAYGSFVKSCMVLSAFAAMLVPVGLGLGPRTTALVFALANVAGTFTLAVMARRDVPWLRFGWQHAQFFEIRRLSAPALAYMAFPLAFAINLQGSLQAVSFALGPIAVVTFATARTVSRIAVQMVQIINSTFEPEISKSFAQRNTALIRTLHRRACQMALLLAFATVIAAIFAGPYLLHHWTQGKVPPSRPLLSILLIVVVFISLWSTSATVMTATNRHKRLAAVYLGATALTLPITALLARYFGLHGAAASLLLPECVMNLYVLPTTLKLVGDTFPAFAWSLFQVPGGIHPGRLLKRMVRPSGPAFES